MTKKIIGRKFEFYSAFQVEKTNFLKFERSLQAIS